MPSLGERAPRRSRLLWLLLLAIGLAAATPVQPPGCNQTAHYSLVESLAQGRASLGRYHVQSCDISVIGGRYYAAKAPGLALVSLPAYELLDAAGLVPANHRLAQGYPAAMSGVSPRAVWQLHLWGIVLPAIGLALLLFLAAERLQPGTGIAVAGIAALGTLILPFSTDYFAHVLSAALGFGALAVVLLGRSTSSLRRLLAAGAVAGLAVLVEFTLALVALALGLYLLARPPRLRRLGAYLGGLVLGLVPLGLFDLWAFGSPFRLSYEHAALRVTNEGRLVYGANRSGFFGIGAPHPHTLLTLLFSPRGLLILSPVLALAAVGLVLLFRRGERAEALLVGGICAGFLLFNSGYDQYMGGFVPGPRFLVPAIPFAALALAPVVRRLPLTTAALAVVSIGAMAVATAAGPLLPDDGTHVWLDKWRDANFTESFLSFAVAGHGWLAMSPFLLAVIAAAAAMLASLRRRLHPRDAWPALAAVAAWLLTLRVAPELLRVDQLMGQRWGALALVALVCALAYLMIPTRPWTIAAVLLAPLAVPGVFGHSKISLVLIALVAGATAVLERRVAPRRVAAPIGRSRG